MRGSRLLTVMLLALALLVGSVDAGMAANFPEKPITLIVQSSAGGGSDLFARTLAAIFEKEKLLPQPIVVENKPGGSGAIAWSYILGKRGDPYFLCTAGPGMLTVPILRKTPYTFRDFTPIGNFAFDDFTVITRTESRFKSIADLVREAKANPRRITVGGTQVGSTDSIGAYLFEKAAGIQFNFVSFTGGGEVNAALLGGHIDWAVANPGEAMELVKAKKVRALGVMTDKRLPSMPDVPTLREQGVDAIFRQHRALVAPGNLPAEARKVLDDAMLRYTKTAGFKKYMEDNTLSEGWMDGPTFGKFMEQESAKSLEILKGMGLLKK